MKRELFTRLLKLLAFKSEEKREWVLLVCQHGSFGVTSTATRELKVRNVMRTDYAIVDFEDMSWYALTLMK